MHVLSRLSFIELRWDLFRIYLWSLKRTLKTRLWVVWILEIWKIDRNCESGFRKFSSTSYDSVYFWCSELGHKSLGESDGQKSTRIIPVKQRSTRMISIKQILSPVWSKNKSRTYSNRKYTHTNILIEPSQNICTIWAQSGQIICNYYDVMITYDIE